MRTSPVFIVVSHEGAFSRCRRGELVSRRGGERGGGLTVSVRARRGPYTGWLWWEEGDLQLSATREFLVGAAEGSWCRSGEGSQLVSGHGGAQQQFHTTRGGLKVEDGRSIKTTSF